jgi:fatty acid desaturase
MISNPWINRAAAIVILLMMFVAGHDAGHQQSIKAQNNHPACSGPLKP